MDQQFYFDGPPRFDVGLAPIDPALWLFPDDQSHWLKSKNELIDCHVHEVFFEQARSRPAQIEALNLIGFARGHSISTDEPPLLAASRLVSDDLVIMEQIDGQWTNTACCLCSPTFFSAAFAQSKSLQALHEGVPGDGLNLAGRIGRVFTNLSAVAILERHNWTVQWSDARYTPDASDIRAKAAQAEIGVRTDQLFLRVERQTIRRLPESGAILFTI